MALRTITDFKARLKGGGARPNLFEVELNFPAGIGEALKGSNNDLTRFLVRELPSQHPTLLLLMLTSEEEF